MRLISRLSTSAWVVVLLHSFLFAGCSLFEKRNPLGAGYYLPLDVQLREAPSISEARILYQDACGQAQTIPINTLLHNALTRKTGLVFEKVVTGEKQVSPSSLDGYVDVALGINQTDLVIYQKAKRTYPVTVTLGLDFAYTNTEGTVLFRKKIQSAGSGEVNVPSETGCEVRGIEKVLQDTIATVTDGMALQLGESTKIREQVAARQSGTPRPTVTTSPPSPLQTSVAAAVVPLSAAVSSSEAAREPLPIPSDQPANLTFRAIMRDQNRNLLLHGGEAMTIEVEVKNEGPGTAQGVEIHVGGTPALTEHVSRVLSIGELRPGDVKRVALDGKIGTVKEPLQAELILTLHASSTLAQAPAPKKFVVAMKPESDAEASRMPVDVDQLPKRAGKLRQPKAVAIAIGVGQFRDGSTPRIKFAARDAEMIGAYLTALGGIPPDRVRTLVDSQALKNDMAEVLEEWLPKQADPTTVVYVYFSGLGVADGRNGAVSLVPFDGSTSTASRVYSLRRLQEALMKLPIQQAIVMLDLSLESMAGVEPSSKIDPMWESENLPKDRLMLMIGNRAVQEAHRYDPGQHGLFTYQLLKGLGGGADIDKDGTILAGELCTYAKGQVTKMAREQFANEQEPACIPGPGQGAMSRLQPVARFK